MVRLNEVLYDPKTFEEAGIAHHHLEFEVRFACVVDGSFLPVLVTFTRCCPIASVLFMCMCVCMHVYSSTSKYTRVHTHTIRGCHIVCLCLCARCVSVDA